MSVNSASFRPTDAYSLTYPPLTISKEKTVTQNYRAICLTILYKIGLSFIEDLLRRVTPLKKLSEINKDFLLEMGVQNPEAFYRTQNKTAELALHLLGRFKTRELKLIYDKEEDAFVACDSTFFDIAIINEELAQNHQWMPLSEYLPHFYLQNQTIYCRYKNLYISDLKLTTPLSKSWQNHLNTPSKKISLDPSIIYLPSGREYAKDTFIEHPLFKYTLEKHNVFRFLSSFLKRDSFQNQYEDFLTNITKENWVQFYVENPLSLAYLSLVAFLDARLKQDELFTIHMAASALEESSEQSPAKFTILREDNTEKYLRETGYPPFAFFLISDEKTTEVGERCKRLISSLKEKSPVQRTSIAYVFDSSSDNEESIEKNIFYKTTVRRNYANIIDTRTLLRMAIILPPTFCLELYQATSQLKTSPPSKHTWMFGYSNNKESLDALVVGRPISIASPLFRTPYVHGFRTGKQLGITVHDLTYHLTIDWRNPHTHLFIKLGQEILNLPNQTKETKAIGIELLDREASAYSSSNQESNVLLDFWISLMPLIIRDNCSNPDSDLYQEISNILKNTLSSDFLDIKLLNFAVDYHKRAINRNPSIKLPRRLFILAFLKNLITELDTLKPS